ncbi:porin [Acinetobacter baumannii]|uniref:porin n=1 Tax=Acinetobacter baumannii TaxID=470 RepID=UPI00385AE9B6
MLHDMPNNKIITLFLALFLYPISVSAKQFQPHSDLDINLYGVLDLSSKWENSSHHQDSIKLDSGALSDSIFGLYGQYQLNSDTFIAAHLESAVDIVHGKYIDEQHHFNQAAWLGLGHTTFGELRYGRQYSVGQEFISALEIGSWKDLGIGALLRAADNYQVPHQYSWHSPEISHIQIGISYSPDIEIDTLFQSKNAQQYSFAARYVTDFIYLSSSFDIIDKLNTTDFPKHKPQAIQFGMKYSPSAQQHFSGAWSRQKNGFVGLNAQEHATHSIAIGSDAFLNHGYLDAFYLASAFALHTGELKVQYSQAKAHFENSHPPTHKAKVMSVGYVYPYSEALQLYSYLAHSRNYSVDELWVDERSTFTRLGFGIKYEF